MTFFSTRNAFVFALAAGAICAGALEACSSSGGSGASSGGNGGSGGGTQPLPRCTDGGTSTISTMAGSCTNPTIPIVFSPMYSSFIPGDTLRTFSIPAVTSDGCPATWSLSDPAQAILHAEGFSFGEGTTPGVMVTMSGTGGATAPGTTGQVTVVATESSGACGSSVLTITENTDNDWTIGSARYNRGISLHLGGSGPGKGYVTDDGGSFLQSDGGEPCANCHSQTVKTGQYTDVAHTPEQAGGFSDTQMQDIILNGVVPDGGYFDPSVINSACEAGTTLSPDMPACAQAAYTKWQGFHQWTDITSDEVPGMVCYLRSLTPEGQSGTSNFGQ